MDRSDYRDWAWAEKLKPIDGSVPRQPLERILPPMVVRNLQTIHAGRLYGRLTLTFQNGVVVRSKLGITKLHGRLDVDNPAGEK